MPARKCLSNVARQSIGHRNQLLCLRCWSRILEPRRVRRPLSRRRGWIARNGWRRVAARSDPASFPRARHELPIFVSAAANVRVEEPTGRVGGDKFPVNAPRYIKILVNRAIVEFQFQDSPVGIVSRGWYHGRANRGPLDAAGSLSGRSRRSVGGFSGAGWKHCQGNCDPNRNRKSCVTIVQSHCAGSKLGRPPKSYATGGPGPTIADSPVGG